MMKKLLGILGDERGYVEWLIAAVVAGVLAVLVVATLLPYMRNAHNVTVNRITNLTGSGF